MRSKLLLTTMCVAGSIWAAGCEQHPLRDWWKGRLAHDDASRKAATAAGLKATRSASKKIPMTPPDLANRSSDPALDFATEQVGSATLPNSTAAPCAECVPSLPSPGQQASTGFGPLEVPMPPIGVPKLPPPPAPQTLHLSAHAEVINIGELIAKAAASRTTGTGTAPPPPTVSPKADSFNEITNQRSRLGDGEPYRTLTGEVQQFRRGWRLRYAALDVEDPHGGSVSLSGPGLDRLKDGGRIRVSGTFIPAEDRFSSPRFHLQTVELLDQ